MTRVLALDLGTSSVRAAVYDETATEIPSTVARVGCEPDELGTFDPHRLLEAARQASAGRGESVDAVGCSCFWHSLLALDAHDRPLTPVLTWRDVRSAAHAARLRARFDHENVCARTGAPLHASFWPAKLAWLAGTEPDAFAAARRFVSFADWLLHEEVGELRTSVSMASGTGLWTDEGWDEELLDALGVEADRLPPVSDEPVGNRFPALGDGACSNLGAGCTTPERAAVTIGTSSAFRVITEEVAPPPPGLFRYRLDRHRALVGGALSAGGNLHAWLERTLRLPDTPTVAERPPSAHGLTFLPSLGGERSPTWDPDARGAVAGLTFETSPLDLLQAGLEAVAYGLAEIAERLPGVEEVVATGGALHASSDWTQILADVLERPVIASPVAEASARGAAVYALERLGLDASEPPPGEPALPRLDRADAHRAARARPVQLRTDLSGRA